MLIEVLTGAACAAAGVMAYGVRGRSARLFGRSVWRGPADRPALALTFDDGPSESTLELLALLDRHQVRATFFQCGQNVERLPAVAREVAARGHQIGNHSHSHPRFWLRSGRFLYQELARAQDTIEAATGARPTLFRAPCGTRWPGLAGAQQRLGLLGVMWTVLGRDWALPAEAIALRLIRGARNGAILCLHDGCEVRPQPDVRPMLEAAGRLIPELRARGFRFETVSELLCPTN
ncbi:MAG: polysaccharide deacetylase family protein [Acidobacteria bacterium]|nr:polysaccharide deacetylase family protein [Acidobacteriota bacterium]